MTSTGKHICYRANGDVTHARTPAQNITRPLQGTMTTSWRHTHARTHQHKVVEDSERHHDDEEDGRAVGDDDERRDTGGERAQPDAQRQRDVDVNRVDVFRKSAPNH